MNVRDRKLPSTRTATAGSKVGMLPMFPTRRMCKLVVVTPELLRRSSAGMCLAKPVMSAMPAACKLSESKADIAIGTCCVGELRLSAVTMIDSISSDCPRAVGDATATASSRYASIVVDLSTVQRTKRASFWTIVLLMVTRVVHKLYRQ
jgi:hypothetical protein